MKRKFETLQKITVSQNIDKTFRHFFLRWKQHSDQHTLAKELYEEGIVRQQEIGYRHELSNLRELMRLEGYDDQDINIAQQKFKTKQRGLILKTIRRLQHFNSSLYLKPKMLDRWREYIQVKKQWRYYLNFVDKRAEFIKSDLHQAFDQWKSFHDSKKDKLVLKSKAELNSKAVTNNKILDKLSEDIQDKENTIDHLNAQRETLLDNYIKAQKLALSLWNNRNKNQMHEALMRWSDRAKKRRNFETSECLKRNLATLESLKLRIQQFEADNESLANENEELRQFSLDGYEIAKNVQALSAEREILSVDLADKAQVIKKLLDENELLTRQLQKAQEHAQTLIRSTMRRGIARGSSGERGASAGLQGISRGVRS